MIQIDNFLSVKRILLQNIDIIYQNRLKRNIITIINNNKK